MFNGRPDRSSRTAGRPAGWRAALVLLAGIALAACGGPEPGTHGTVRDNFGVPVAGASVAVDGEAATAVTDAEGRFTITYKDGRFPTVISHPGHTTGNYTLRVSTEENRPPVEAVLQRLPDGPGLYLVGADGYKAANPCTIGVLKVEDPAGNWYLVEHGIPTLAPTGPGAPLTLLDYGGAADGAPRALARVTHDTEFYRTQPPANRDPLIYEEPRTTEITPDFPAAGHWFQITPAAGVYVYSGRVKEAVTNYPLPDPDGACFIFTVGPAGEGWLGDAISETAFAAFLDKVKSCWPPPPEGIDRAQRVTLRIALRPDGTVEGEPRQVRGTLDTFRQRPAYSLAANMAAAAVTGCAPYTMFAPADPALWRDLLVTFDTGRLFTP